MLDVAIHCDDSIETIRGTLQQLTILETLPSETADRLDLVTSQ